MKNNRIRRFIFEAAPTLFVVVCLQLLSALLCLSIGVGSQSDVFMTLCVIFCINQVLRIYRSILDIEEILSKQTDEND